MTEEDVRRAERLAEVSLLRREVERLSPHQKVLPESVYNKEEKRSLLRFIGNSTISYDLVAGNKSHTRRFQHLSLNWNYTATSRYSERDVAGAEVSIFTYIRLIRLNGKRYWMR